MESEKGDSRDVSSISDLELKRGFQATLFELSLRPQLLRECIPLLEAFITTQSPSEASSSRTNTPSSLGLSSGSSFLSSTSIKAHIGTTHTSTTNLDQRLADPTSTSLRTRRRPKPVFTCTLCLEVGVCNKTFKEKADWKRHMSNFHETGKEWQCSLPECMTSFARERDYLQHHQKHHRSSKSSCRIRDIPNKLAHPCGFSGCRVITPTWLEWCDHVAKCTQSDKSWEYSNRMRNLLKQTIIQKIWKAARNQVCNQHGIAHHELVWYPDTSRDVLERLQCEKLTSLSTGVFVKIAQLGLPQASRVVTRSMQGEEIFGYSSALDASTMPSTSSYFHQNDLPSPTLSSWNSQALPPSAFFTEPPNLASPSIYAQNRYSVAMPDAPLELEGFDDDRTIGVPVANFGLDHVASDAVPACLTASEHTTLLDRSFDFPGHSNTGPGLTSSGSPVSTFDIRETSETSWLDVTFDSSPVPKRKLPLNFARPFLSHQ